MRSVERYQNSVLIINTDDKIQKIILSLQKLTLQR